MNKQNGFVLHQSPETHNMIFIFYTLSFKNLFMFLFCFFLFFAVGGWGEVLDRTLHECKIWFQKTKKIDRRTKIRCVDEDR